MKKTLISLVLIAAMLCSFGGLVYADDVKDLPEQQPEAAAAVTAVSVQAVAPGMEFIPGSVPAESAPMEGMIPPINALVLSMLEQDLVYDEDSDVFLWNSVYYMISLYGQMDSRAELTDDTLILPTETLEDYAAALFTNYHGLPQLPEQLKDRVSYDSQNDTYRLARGDAGLSETRLSAARQMPDGTIQVNGTLVALENENPLCSFTAVLTANNSMFGYSISGLNIME